MRSIDLVGLEEEAAPREQRSGAVMVVDDDSTNRELLRGILESKGHLVRESPDGQDLLDQLSHARGNLPDVILLDIIMPRLDGYATCRAIKRNPGTAHIPVIIITGLTDREDRLRGIQEGANDFLTKPFDAAEVALRVGNGVASKRMFDTVLQEYRRVRELEETRDSLVHMIVHDLRQPLTALGGYVEYLASSDKSGNHGRILGSMKDISSRMALMIASLLDVQKLEEGKMPLSLVSCNLADLIRSVADPLSAPSASNIGFEVDVPPAAEVVCDPELIGRVVSNLLDNAVKHAPKGSSVVVRLKQINGTVRIEVIDFGTGIPAEHHAKIFEKFGQVALFSEGHRFSWGLGLTFCKMAVEAHHGTIEVESTPGKGSTFRVTLPVHPDE
ncbi:MAG TPA: hybrid sensor histidine kinase/response regulator [Spirochaetia bacterium]|nr:hybrid sensor histidine kinase/response regulator [Spirochaetia bacterium]